MRGRGKVRQREGSRGSEGTTGKQGNKGSGERGVGGDSTCGGLPHDLALSVFDQLAPLQQPPEDICRCVLQKRQLL